MAEKKSTIHSSTLEKDSRPVAGRECVFTKCSHPSHVITKEDNGVVVAVPSKKMKRLGQAARSKLVVNWSETANATFHEDCWRLILESEKLGTSTRGGKASEDVLTAADAALVREVCETAEVFETIGSLQKKAIQVARLLNESTHTAVFTGAGISASAGIPTYRGTDGIDVIAEFGGAVKNEEKVTAAEDAAVAAPLESGEKTKKGQKRKEPSPDPYVEMSEEYLKLKPTTAHLSISRWATEGKVHFVITQNCDNLHVRSGVPLEKMAELHGNVFVEYCEKCFKEYRRPYCVDLFSTDCRKEKWYVECPTCHFNHYTGRKCADKTCKGKLKDTIVNFGDDLHEKVLGGLDLAIAQCKLAQLVLCLGSSLTVTPASNLPTLLPKGGKIVIVNLQETELDDKAAVRVWGTTDMFFQLVQDALDGKVSE